MKKLSFGFLCLLSGYLLFEFISIQITHFKTPETRNLSIPIGIKTSFKPCLINPLDIKKPFNIQKVDFNNFINKKYCYIKCTGLSNHAIITGIISDDDQQSYITYFPLKELTLTEKIESISYQKGYLIVQTKRSFFAWIFCSMIGLLLFVLLALLGYIVFKKICKKDKN